MFRSRVFFAIGLGVVALACQPAPSPSPPSVPPTAVAQASTVPTTAPDLTPRPTPTPVPDPQAPVPPSGTIAQFDVQLRSLDGRFETEVVLFDQVGVVTGIEDANAAIGGIIEGVAAPIPDGSDGFVYGWLGGACDTRTTLVLATLPDGSLSLVQSTERDPGPCILIGIGRSVIVRTSAPVDAGSIVVRAPG